MRLTFHIARHTFGTMLADATQNPYLIMDLMGHADIKTSMIYIHRSQERINKQLRGGELGLNFTNGLMADQLAEGVDFCR